MSKEINDYDLLEAICGNDLAISHCVIQFETPITMHMDCNIELEAFSPIEHFDDLPFKDIDAYGVTFLITYNKLETFKPTSRISPRQRRKGKPSVKGALNMMQYANLPLQ